MEKISAKLKRTAFEYEILLSAQKLFSVLTGVMILLWFLALLNGVFWFAPSERSFFLGVVVCAIIAGAFWAFKKLLFSPMSERAVALMFEKQFPQLQETLITTIDIGKNNVYGFSPAIISGVGQYASEHFLPLSSKGILPIDQVRKNASFFALSLLLIASSAVISPEGFGTGLLKVLFPARFFAKTTQTMLSVFLPNDAQAVRYADYTITINASGVKPEKVFVHRRLQNEFAPFEAQADAATPNTFRFTFRNIAEDVEFFVSGGDYKSQIFMVRTLDLPRVVDVSYTIDYPTYTNMPSRTVERNDGNIDVLAGSRISLVMQASKVLAAGHIEFFYEDGDTAKRSEIIPLIIDGRRAEAEFFARRKGHYVIVVEDGEKQTDPQPPQYAINISFDENPVVQIANPGKDTDLDESMRVPLQIFAEDDFGFSRFELCFVVQTPESTVEKLRIPFLAFGKKQVTVEYTWDLSSIGILPDDMIRYWVEAFDNDAITGPKMSRSKAYTLRFPSILEIMNEVETEREEQINTVDEALKSQQEYVEQTKEMIRQIQTDKDKIPYEQKEKVENLLQQQQKLVESLEKAADQMQQTLEKIEQNQLVAQQISEKMQEIQKLLDEILPEQLKEAMRKVQEAMKQMDPEMLKQAMKQLEMSQQELVQKLDQALELLKRLATEMKLDELKNMAQKISEMQDQINKGMEQGMEQEKLSRMQQDVSKQLESLEKQMKELSKEMKEFEDMPSQEMEELSKELENEQLPEESQGTEQDMQQGNKQKAKKRGEKISQKSSDLSKKLGKMQEQMNKNLQQQMTLDIQKTVRELLYIGDELDKLLAATTNPRDKKDIIALAKTQQQIRTSLSLAIERVGDMAGKSFLLPPAVSASLASADAKMASSAEKLSAGNWMTAQTDQADAKGSVNAAGEMLLRSMDNMCNSSSASGSQQMMQQLQKMCQSQGQLNQQTLPLMGACQNPGGLSPSQQAAAQRLAEQQSALRKTLEELAQEFEQQANTLGKMDQTIDDMKKVEQDLRSFDITERTMKNQERIMSRMLDAQKSLHKREFTEKRKSRTGDDVLRKSPNALPDDFGERKDVLQQSLLQILKNPYPRQYQEELRKYFQALGEDYIPASSKNVAPSETQQ